MAYKHTQSFKFSLNTQFHIILIALLVAEKKNAIQFDFTAKTVICFDFVMKASI